MEMLTLLDERSLAHRLKARKKDDCLVELAQLLSNQLDVTWEEVLEAIRAREEMGSTGFENGVAIPHCKMKGLKDFALAVAVSPKGVWFNSIDGKKSHLFFALAGPEERPQEHLKILAQISRLARNQRARKALLQAGSPQALKEIIANYISPRSLPKTPDKGKQKLLIIVLHEQQFFEDIINLFVEMGIRGANILESSGIRHQLRSIPLFSDFLNFLGEQSEVARTIMVTLPEERLTALVEGVEEITGDLDRHTGGSIMVLDLDFCRGSLEL